MVEAMVYILRTGCPWRDIPGHFGPWSSVYTRSSRWAQAGLWAALLDILAQDGEVPATVFANASSPPGTRLASRPAQADAIQSATIAATTNGDIAWRISFSALVNGYLVGAGSKDFAHQRPEYADSILEFFRNV